MEQNKLFDIIISGDDPAGLELAMALSGHNKSICYITENWEANDRLNWDGKRVTVVNGHVVYMGFIHGVIIATVQAKYKYNSIYGATATQVCGTHFVIAHSDSYAPIDVPSDTQIYYELVDLPLQDRDKKTLAILGNSKELTDTAMKLAKEYKNIYYCFDTRRPEGPAIIVNKTGKLENVQYLPLCKVKKIEKGIVYLSTGAEIKADHILAFNGRMPNISGIPTNMITVDKTNHIVVDENYHTGPIPTMYAIGTVCNKTSASDSIKLFKQLV